MSLSDFTKQDAADIATVLHLAALTEDRTRVEQKALERLAAKVDKQRNRQSAYAATDVTSRLAEVVEP